MILLFRSLQAGRLGSRKLSAARLKGKNSFNRHLPVACLMAKNGKVVSQRACTGLLCWSRKPVSMLFIRVGWLKWCTIVIKPLLFFFSPAVDSLKLLNSQCPSTGTKIYGCSTGSTGALGNPKRKPFTFIFCRSSAYFLTVS